MNDFVDCTRDERVFQKLRTDLMKKLSPIKLLLVNADGLIEGEQAILDSPALRNGHEAAALRMQGVEVLAFSNRKSEGLSQLFRQHGIELLYQDASRQSALYSSIKAEKSLADNEIAILTGNLFDAAIIEMAAFPVATFHSSLELKTKCCYVTYRSGLEAVAEIAEIILKAKKYPSGYSD